MTLLVGAAAHGSPGVSTALQLLAALWPASRAVPVIVEADASGGVLAARYELSINPGFVSLAESLRQGEAPALLDHSQRLPSGVACVTLSPSATAASAQMRSAGPYLGSYLAASGHPVLLDAGTLLPDAKTTSAVAMADLLLWFVRPTREELLVLRHRMAETPQPENVGIVLIGSTPYNAEQVTEALGVPVVHTLPVDRRGAEAANLGGDDRFLRRSQLARSAAKLAGVIGTRLGGNDFVLSDLAPQAGADKSASAQTRSDTAASEEAETPPRLPFEPLAEEVASPPPAPLPPASAEPAAEEVAAPPPPPSVEPAVDEVVAPPPPPAEPAVDEVVASSPPPRPPPPTEPAAEVVNAPPPPPPPPADPAPEPDRSEIEIVIPGIEPADDSHQGGVGSVAAGLVDPKPEPEDSLSAWQPDADAASLDPLAVREPDDDAPEEQDELVVWVNDAI